MENFGVKPIGTFQMEEGGLRIALDKAYIPALAGLEGFSHVQVLWWFSGADNAEARSSLREESPYLNAPDFLGTFATRSPARPNPIALSCAEVIAIDPASGIIEIAYADADEGSPVLDIKPYTPSLDRVENPKTPGWCAHWPKSVESSGDFDWESEFTF